MLRKWGMLVVMLLVTPMLAWSQTTGKIAGQVIDQDTGEGLPGASVTLVGTLQGTVTDIDGNYFIIGVAVGSYDVQASFVGYQTETITGVEVSSGKTSEINFNLSAGLELDEIVVEYERPIIQKDAIGVPKVVTSEDIQNLPVRGVASVAALQGGVVSSETSSNLFIRGGREQEVAYYVDGVKVIGAVAVPTQSIQEQEMLIGSIPARYGDAMSGIISITTKTGAQKFFGSVEAITSEVLDDFGYNTFAATVGGPIVQNRASFFLSGEFRDREDAGPRAVGFPTISDDLYDLIQQNPQVVSITNDETGEEDFVPFPGNLIDNPDYTDANGDFAVPSADAIALINVPEGWHLTDAHPSPIFAPLTFTGDDFTRENARPSNSSQAFTLNGNLTFSPIDDIRIRLGGGFETSDGDSYSYLRQIYAQDRMGQFERDTYRMSGAWTHYLSNSTFYQLTIDFSDYKGANFANGFSSDIEDIINYGILGHENNAVAQRYYRYNETDDTYEQSYNDGSLPGSRDIQNTFAPPGTIGFGYSKFHNRQLGFRANATTQVGLHQLEFGGEYQQRTNRFFNIGSPYGLANFEGAEYRFPAASDDSSSAGLTFEQMDPRIFYYGYDYLGLNEVDDEDLNGFVNKTNYNMEPYRPIYYAGYIADKVEYRDIVLQVGVRVDVFDNNSKVLFDRYSFVEIERAGDQGISLPGNIGSDYAVYFDESSDEIRGYRDLDGNFYLPSGQEADATTDVTFNAAPKIVGGGAATLSDGVFTDYEPQVTVQPRIGVTFPVTDQALFYASYDVVTQRPSERTYDTVQQYQQALEGGGLLNNPALEPERTAQYELGFRQRLGVRSAVQLSGFFRQIENKIQRRIVHNAFPGNYQTFENVDFGTVKGVEFEYDLRRTRGVQFNANYTLSFAKGTGADANSVGQITWRQETSPFYPTFLSPLDFDQRHKFNATLDYRLGKGEGPQVGNAHPLENFGVNIVGTVGTGLPYTRRRDNSPLYTSFNGFLEGALNEQTMPTTALVNLRVDRKFSLGNADLTLFVWVQNLLDSDNVQNVYSTTGLADDDGFLALQEGIDAVNSIRSQGGDQVAASFVDHYGFAARTPFNYGIPRQTRIGFRVNF